MGSRGPGIDSVEPGGRDPADGRAVREDQSHCGGPGGDVVGGVVPHEHPADGAAQQSGAAEQAQLRGREPGPDGEIATEGVVGQGVE
jgi:hypothetical protein